VPGTLQTSNLPAGVEAPGLGIYVVSHFDPAHTQPHEVLITKPMVLPKCSQCNDVRFSLRCSIPPRIEESSFFDSVADHDTIAVVSTPVD
jgi:hypothetical protein